MPLAANSESIIAEALNVASKGKTVDTVGKGWRVEQDAKGYYRWRWQLKDDTGKPITYTGKSGKTAYKRGSKYVGKEKPSQ